MLHPSSTLYRVYHSCGAGTARGPAFKSLEDARRYVLEQRTPGSFAIRRPDGTWHRWGPSDSVVHTVSSEQRFARGTLVEPDAPTESDAPRRISSPLGYPPGVPYARLRK